VVAVHGELTQTRVMAVAEDLGARGATGVLEVKGEPSGAVYLDSGRITFARASWVPDLADRLRGIRPSSAESRDREYRDADDAAIATLAVQRGHITTQGLHQLIRSIVVDAFLVLMIPLPVNAYVADIRFTSARTHATPLFPRLDIDSVRSEALSRADRMAKYGLAPTTAVALRDLRQPTAVLTREQWAAASQITENASARELARRHGTGLADMTECLGGLTRAGLCAPVRISGPRQLAPAGSAPVGPRSPQPTRPDHQSGRDQTPTADVLRQVLNGLRNLS
jgi:hypothetical protein